MPDVSVERNGLPSADAFNALPAGTRFDELEIVRSLGIGGFGIVYLAHDHALQRQIAIKEYMPGQLAWRDGGSGVSVRDASLLETFELGRRSFVNEARLLARFDHRSLLKVYRFWEANGTAYMAMPYLQGRNLRQVHQAMDGRPDEAWLLRLLLPVLEGLGLLHAAEVVHRDIAPDNILLPDDGGDAILLDFGAARRAINGRTDGFTAILKPSYAPIEQYAEAAGLRQGPWTDLYAVGAVVHFLLLGSTPPPATTRTLADDYQPLAQMNLPGLSTGFLAAIDWALAVRPQERPQSVAEFRAALCGERAAPQPQTLAMALSADTVDFELTQLEEYVEDLPAAPAAAPAPQRRAWPRPSALLSSVSLAALLLLGGGAWWQLRGEVEPAAETALPEPSAAVLVAVSASEPAPAVASAASEPLATPATTATTATPASVAAVLPPPVKANEQRPAKPAAAPARERSAAAAGEGSAARLQPSPPPPASAQRSPEPATRPAVAAATEGAGSSDPLQTCASQSFFARAYCIDRECEKPAWAAHPECVRLREIGEQRGRRSGN